MSILSSLIKVAAAALLGVLAVHVPAHANTITNDPMIEGARMCTQYLPRKERELGIPLHLLAAIASAESGRYHQGLGLRLPWPWTINAEGQGYFFRTKDEAIAAVQRLQSKGVSSIDVGCMQVNLRHHPKAFASLEQAFDPAYNVTYAAGFLHNNFAELKSWKSATAAYHSRTPFYGSQYVARVFEGWNKIHSKIAQARSGVLPLERSKWDLPKFSSVADVDTQLPNPKFASSRTVRGAVRTASNATRQNGVLVIRPNTRPAAQAASGDGATQIAMNEDSPLIQAKSAKTASSSQFNPRSKIVRVGDNGIRMGKGTSISVTPSAPQFVFDN